MKKVLSIVAALLLCVGTQAQIVSSRSAIVKTQKQASNTQWFLRAGLNIMNLKHWLQCYIRLSKAYGRCRSILGNGIRPRFPWV